MIQQKKLISKKDFTHTNYEKLIKALCYTENNLTKT